MSVKLSSIEVYLDTKQVSVELELAGNYIEVELNDSEGLIQKMYDNAMAQYEEYLADQINELSGQEKK
jgi:hypothetical protein